MGCRETQGSHGKYFRAAMVDAFKHFITTPPTNYNKEMKHTLKLNFRSCLGYLSGNHDSNCLTVLIIVTIIF
jgi:hypothetical protein